jgi:tRNA(Ile)-lysidine synthase
VTGPSRGGTAATTAQLDSNTPVSPELFTPRWLALRLHELLGPLRGRRFCIAYSGGLDSGALLAALAVSRKREGFRLRAIHIDHGLHERSGAWAAAAAQCARAWRVRCETIELKLKIARGESVEAVAREARYEALRARLEPDEALLTAHNQDDQLETVLLALMRGSGVGGLAAMKASTLLGHTVLLRPLLSVARSQLERFAREHELKWTEDASNVDERFDRNYLRRRVVPALTQRWPAAAATASRSAAHLAEAQELLAQLARHSAAQAADGDALRVSVLRRFTLSERGNVLRWWLRQRGLTVPDHRRVREILGPMLEARADARPHVRWRGGELRRHGDQLVALTPGAEGNTATSLDWDWRSRAWLPLGGGRALGLIRDRHGDVDLAALPCPLRVGFRRGGERMHSAHGRVALKDILQSQGIAPWERAEVPLLLDGERLLAVADLWLDPAYRASGGDQPSSPAARGRFRWRRTPIRTRAALD